MRRLLTILFLAFFLSSASATTIQSENVTVDLSSSNVHIDLRVGDLTSSELSYITSYKIDNVDARIDGERLECSTSPQRFGSEIKCETDRKNNFTTKLNFTFSDLVTERNNANVFRYSHSVYRPTENYQLKVILPQGTGVIDRANISTPVVSPLGAEIGSNGRRIFVEWNQKPGLGDTIEFKVIFEKLSDSSSNLAGSFYIVIATLLILGVGAAIYRYRGRENIEDIYSEITEDEKDVVELLKQNGGEMLQKDIVNKSDYSKAKISGVVSSLVDKEVIEKEKEGRSNKLKIAKNFNY